MVYYYLRATIPNSLEWSFIRRLMGSFNPIDWMHCWTVSTRKYIETAIRFQSEITCSCKHVYIEYIYNGTMVTAGRNGIIAPILARNEESMLERRKQQPLDSWIVSNFDFNYQRFGFLKFGYESSKVINASDLGKSRMAYEMTCDWALVWDLLWITRVYTVGGARVSINGIVCFIIVKLRWQ